MFDVSGLWLMKLVLGDIALPQYDYMKKDIAPWVERDLTLVDVHDIIDYQTEYVMDLVKDVGEDYPHNIDISEYLHTWAGHKEQNILTYRDQSFTSKYTGTLSPKSLTTFMDAKDDSLTTFIGQLEKSSNETVSTNFIESIQNNCVLTKTK